MLGLTGLICEQDWKRYVGVTSREVALVVVASKIYKYYREQFYRRKQEKIKTEGQEHGETETANLIWS